MQQKITWIIFLATGISSLISACGKTRNNYVVKGEFRYYNKVEDTLAITIKDGPNKAYEAYTVLPGDSLVLFTSAETDSKTATPTGYKPAIAGDSTVVRFGDSLCYGEYHFAGQALQNIGAYTYEQRGERDYIFFFDIDSSLKEKAIKCP